MEKLRKLDDLSRSGARSRRGSKIEIETALDKAIITELKLPVSVAGKPMELRYQLARKGTDYRLLKQKRLNK
jgi:hypothetical protein